MRKHRQICRMIHIENFNYVTTRRDEIAVDLTIRLVQKLRRAIDTGRIEIEFWLESIIYK